VGSYRGTESILFLFSVETIPYFKEDSPIYLIAELSLSIELAGLKLKTAVSDVTISVPITVVRLRKSLKQFSKCARKTSTYGLFICWA
jgi:hypothetical protein